MNLKIVNVFQKFKIYSDGFQNLSFRGNELYLGKFNKKMKF